MKRPGYREAVDWSAYRETSDMVQREGAAYGPREIQPQENSPMLPSHTTTAPTAPSGTIPPQGLISATGERQIGRYDFEGGAYVRVSAGGEIDTDAALDMVQTLIDLKRRELARKKQDVISPGEKTNGSGENE